MDPLKGSIHGLTKTTMCKISTNVEMQNKMQYTLHNIREFHRVNKLNDSISKTSTVRAIALILVDCVVPKNRKENDHLLSNIPTLHKKKTMSQDVERLNNSSQ